ncbi:DUF4336 domain-containing protein [Pseudoalteromonas rubra]|uniref:DUF4336 domain-containing protein n=1 Tax=Pseudoalteromonas rubra TaxID=43658 RepID=A0A4Q7E0F4_9GAMM|nr:DUF4336 domain-containing protein [Pseudoalteromonas rubra]RZM73339.1 hypothetical protein C3B51_20725 [Pseudoalteromonas rubra]
MRQLDDNIWIFDGEAVSFYTMPFTTRMTIVRLACGGLWVHSPIRLTPELREQVDALGPVTYLVAPNHLHHLFMAPWQETYPEAQTFGTQEVKDKCDTLRFDGIIDNDHHYPWDNTLKTLLFTGSPAMEEAIFYHPQSSTLLVTDLIENFDPDSLNTFQRFVAKGAGVVAPEGQTPLDWRLSFIFHHDTARKHLATMLGWAPKRLVMAHGLIIEKDAVAFLQRAFEWLNE